MFKNLVALALLLNSTVADNFHKVKFLRDFLDSEIKPTSLNVWKNCFEDRDKIELIRNSFTPTVFSNEDSLNATDYKINPQHCLFLLDLTCKENQANIIGKV